jgi:hypothetical protein
MDINTHVDFIKGTIPHRQGGVGVAKAVIAIAKNVSNR